MCAAMGRVSREGKTPGGKGSVQKLLAFQARPFSGSLAPPGGRSELLSGPLPLPVRVGGRGWHIVAGARAAGAVLGGGGTEAYGTESAPSWVLAQRG